MHLFSAAWLALLALAACGPSQPQSAAAPDWLPQLARLSNREGLLSPPADAERLRSPEPASVPAAPPPVEPETSEPETSTEIAPTPVELARAAEDAVRERVRAGLELRELGRALAAIQGVAADELEPTAELAAARARFVERAHAEAALSPLENLRWLPRIAPTGSTNFAPLYAWDTPEELALDGLALEQRIAREARERLEGLLTSGPYDVTPPVT